MSAAEGCQALSHRGYIPGLDGIRALAVGLVLFEHSVIYGQFNYLSSMGLNAGRTGVDAFFVLSGYLITTLLLREERRTGFISLPLFYIRRAMRLFPALWLYLSVVGAIALAGWLPHNPWHSFVSSLLYIRNLVGRGHETEHLWSLSIEEQFYILWPLVLVGLPRRDRARLAAALGALIGITVWRVHATRMALASPGALCMRSDFRFDSPLFGCVLALALQVAPKTVNWTNRTRVRSDLMTVVGLVGLAVWIGMRLDEVLYPGTSDTVSCLLGLVLILSQTGEQGRVSNWLTWLPLVTVGQISYGVYLWQMLFVGPQTTGFESIRSFPIGLLSTFFVAFTSYWCLEKPILKLKDRYFRTSAEQRPAVSPEPMLTPVPASVYTEGSALQSTPIAPR